MGAIVALRRLGSWRDLAPSGLLLLSQSLWFSVPLVLRNYQIDSHVEPWESSNGPYYFLWIAIAHSLQYLWITSWTARSSDGWPGMAPYLVKALLAGALVWVLPALLFAPAALGRLPFDAGLAILVASAVNIHHFILDGAVWKLRQGRVARLLLRSRPPDPEIRNSADLSAVRLGIRGAVWTLGAVCVAILFAGKWEVDYNIRAAARTGSLEAVRSVSERLAWLGRDSARLRLLIGRMHARRGEGPHALRESQRSNALHGAALNHDLGKAWLAVDRPEPAAEAFRKASELEPSRRLHQLMFEHAVRAERDREPPR